MKKILLRLTLIIAGVLLCPNLFSQIINYSTRFLSQVDGSVRLRLSNQVAGDNTFYPSSKVPYGITMTNTNNLVDPSGHWEFTCVGKRRGLAYIQGGWRTENWAPIMGLDEGYAYIARAEYFDTSWHASTYTYVKIYCESFRMDAVIEYVTDYYQYGPVSPEIFEEGFQVYDPLMAYYLLDEADKNYDALISREERYAITELFLRYQDPLNLLDGNTYLQYFPNLKTLDIGPYKDNEEASRVYQGRRVATNRGFGVYCDRLVVENANVNSIRIGWNNEIKHVDLSKCPNVKSVIMYDVSCMDVVLPRRIQVTNATFWVRLRFNSGAKLAKKYSIGVRKPSFFLGLLLSLSRIRLISLSSRLSKEVPFGRYCRMSPFMFSLAPLSHEW